MGSLFLQEISELERMRTADEMSAAAAAEAARLAEIAAIPIPVVNVTEPDPEPTRAVAGGMMGLMLEHKGLAALSTALAAGGAAYWYMKSIK
eukprot:8394351-Pyramimonas_sp.AAC.1